MRTRGPLHVLRRRWISIVVLAVLAVLAAVVYTLTAPVAYRASASAFFSLTTGQSAADLVQGSTYAQNEISSFAELATTPAVLQPVISDLGLQTTPAALAGQVQATVPVGTVIVDVTVTDSSPTRAARLANGVVGSLSAVVRQIAPKDAAGRSTVTGTTVAPAVVPSGPASPRPLLDVTVALVAGLVVGGAVAWAKDAVDTRIRDAEMLLEVTDLPLVGSVGSWTERPETRVVVAATPHSPQAESFRQLRTNLQFLRVAEDSDERPEGAATLGAHVITVTSALPGEGKSTIATNLAAALAETGAAVLLVDADLRRPRVADVLGLEGAVGLTTVLAGEARLEDVVQEWGDAGLRVLPSGAVPPNPAELLGSTAMRRVVAEVRRAYDYVVLDTAPVLPVADAAVLSRVVDGALVVVQAGKTRRHQLARALAGLSQVSATVFGVALNRVRGEEKPYAYRSEPPAGQGTHSGAAPAGVPVARISEPYPGRLPVG